MEEEKSSFKHAFTYLYFLMLSADKVADLKELKLGNKIMQLEKLDKNEVMKDLDILSTMPRETVFEQGMNYMRSASREIQLRCLAYIKLMAKVDGSMDENERELLNEISTNELKISIGEISSMENKLKKAIDNVT